MADEIEDEIGAKAIGPDALASHIALDAGTAAEAREYLRRQNDIAALQIENLRKQDEYETSHLRWRRFNDQMRGALQLMVVAIGLLIVGGIGMAVWNAASDKGLVIDSFGVPPDLAAKGLTGDVIANKVLDKLSEFQDETGSGRAPASYANNWGDDIKVQIPDTGVSISEFNRALHQWLGHETHITGEVYRTPDGIAIVARAGKGTPVVKGSEADIDALIEKVTENIYSTTQPYRYAAWLSAQGRTTESTAQLQHIIATAADPMERAWAYNGMAHNTIITGASAAADGWAYKAVAADPSLVLPRSNITSGEFNLGHDENALAAARGVLKADAAGDATIAEAYRARYVVGVRGILAQLLGDNAAMLDLAKRQVAIDPEGGRQDETLACALLHDMECFNAAYAGYEPAYDGSTRINRAAVLQQANTALEQWDAVTKSASAFHDGLLHAAPIDAGTLWIFDAPLQALAAAHLGDFANARRLADTMPKDCVLCMRAHGWIETLAHNAKVAEWWFARASAAAPSGPLVDNDWGATLLARSDAAGAIVKFERAHKKGPHFADPLEGWGEALMLQNRSDLALSKFSEAAQYAPNWGRLHLKWAEALHYAGEDSEAQKQFALALSLFLTPSEKAELAHMKARHG